MDGAENPEQEHRDGKRADGQDRPDLAAAEVREEQREELRMARVWQPSRAYGFTVDGRGVTA